jgi:drug/metabolite transporter (DMT)-like permease
VTPVGASTPANNTRGMLIMFATTLIMVCMHTVVRHVGQDLPTAEVVFFRNLFSLIVVMPLLLRSGGLSQLKTQHPWMHLLRTGVGIFAMWSWFYGLAHVPVAQATALSFTNVMFGTLAAVIILGERLRLRRWTAIAIGFVGALIILRPGYIEITPGVIAVLFSSLCWAVALIIVKWISQHDSVLCIVGWNAILLTVFSIGPALYVWQTPTPTQLGWLFLIGFLATIAHLAMTTAFKIGDASVIFPMDFARLIWASIIGYLAFAEIPNMWTWIGGLIIFSSTAYITYRESQIKHVKPVPAPPP